MKKLLNLSMAVLLLVLSHQATAMIGDPLTPVEQTLLEQWNAHPELRDEILEAFWADIKMQVDEVNAVAPINVAPWAVIMKIDFIAPVTTYFIVVDGNMLHTIPSKAAIVHQMCNGLRSRLYLMTFGGVINYVHYKKGVADAHGTMTVSGKDCTGI
jgi:hypothetical protein